MSTNTDNERKHHNAKNPFRSIEMESSILSQPSPQPQQAIKIYTVNKLSHFLCDFHLQNRAFQSKNLNLVKYMFIFIYYFSFLYINYNTIQPKISHKKTNKMKSVFCFGFSFLSSVRSVLIFSFYLHLSQWTLPCSGFYRFSVGFFFIFTIPACNVRIMLTYVLFNIISEICSPDIYR